ncbi:MAG: hypothetical protein KDB41_01825 [Propionibacteriaceae bacterium]|jgi:hypothetical protein|nr:hypothetical protein [Propionibacteriaceae bacterium]
MEVLFSSFISGVDAPESNARASCARQRVGAGTAAAVVDLADAEPTASLSLAEDRR